MKTKTDLCKCGHGKTAHGTSWCLSDTGHDSCDCEEFTPKGKEFNAYKNGDSTYNCGVFKEHENCHVKECGCECHEKGKESADAKSRGGGAISSRPLQGSTAPFQPFEEALTATIEAAAKLFRIHIKKIMDWKIDDWEYSIGKSMWRREAKQILLAAEKAGEKR